MTDTLCVLALDAADYDLVKRWECKNLLLDDHSPLEVFSHSLEVPYTPEVWTTVATGIPPDEHTVEGDVRQWNNPWLERISNVTRWLPSDFRERLGDPFRAAGAERSFKRTDADHVFDRVFGWPGVTEADHLWEAWTWYGQAEEGDLTARELDWNLRGNTGQEVGWLASVGRADLAAIGVHAHVLDVVGHVYADDPERLRTVYEWVDNLVGWLREYVDRLVLLSDHGMQTTVSGDDEPGRHSWRAFISSQGVDDAHPESAFDAAAWLDTNAGEGPDAASDDVDVSGVRDQLADLGYLDS